MKKINLSEELKNIDYKEINNYKPSTFAIEFVNFIKMVNGEEGESHSSPPIHYIMIDKLATKSQRILNMLYRGSSKTTVFAEYLILYLAVYGKLPNFGDVNLIMYVSDSIENGVKNLRKNLEYRYYNSEFLQTYVPEIRFTDVRWEFTNIENKKLIARGFGIATGVRGPLALDELVYTDSGIKTIKDVDVIDSVFAPDGSLVKVLDKSEVFHNDMYELEYTDGRKLKVNKTHLNPVWICSLEGKKKVISRIDLTTEELHKNFSKNKYYTMANKPLDYSEKEFDVDLYNLGYRGRFIEDKYLYGSIKQRKLLLGGLLDRSGKFDDNGKIFYLSKIEHLVSIVRDLSRSLGYIVKTPINNKLYSLSIDCYEDPYVSVTNKHVFSRKRKFDGLIPLKSITPIAQEPSQCISVDHPDHLFLTTGYLTTHNSKELGQRYDLALLDDLMSDEAARSPTITADIENIVYKAVNHALDPTKKKIIWSGTPFNTRDPFYRSAESGMWDVNIFPVCEAFPCSREEFRGAWEDRFDYDFIKSEYESAISIGNPSHFFQELMLQVISEEDRSILDSDIKWFNRANLLKNRDQYFFYITTDLATSASSKADYSVISVWAYDNDGNWYLVDGVLKQMEMNDSMDHLFRLAKEYKPMEVGIEISGQQGGFIPWIKERMLKDNVFFRLAGKGNTEGIRPTKSKRERFVTVEPWFKTGSMHFPKELENELLITEALYELSLITFDQIKSTHDDFIDTVSQLQFLKYVKPGSPLAVDTTQPTAPDTIFSHGFKEMTSDGDDKNSIDEYLI